MAIGILKDQTRVGVMTEVTEGTYVVPAAATDYIQPLEDGFELSPSRELIERQILTTSIAQIVPRPGMRGVEATLPVELVASGTEGAVPDYDLLLKGALGNSRAQASQTTSDTSHTTSVINMDASSVLNFTVGDIIAVLDTGDHTVHAVASINTGVGTEAITITPVRDSAPADAVAISKFTTYYPANTGHASLSLSYYWANEIDQRATGCKVTSMSLDNFQTGQLGSLNFGLSGLGFTEADGAAPHTPTFDGAIPPLILNACVYQAGVRVDVNTFSLSLTNTLGALTSTCDANGKISQRVTDRAITGSLNPYKDDTTVTQFTNFDTNASFSLFLSAYNPSSTTGEIEMGSVVGIYLPNCILTENKVGDQDGILTDDLSFMAHAGNSGSTDEIFIGVI